MTFKVVFAHGVCRFSMVWCDSLNIDNNEDPKLDNIHYFRRLRTMSKKNGFAV
jgi:hypothetical protein